MRVLSTVLAVVSILGLVESAVAAESELGLPYVVRFEQDLCGKYYRWLVISEKHRPVCQTTEGPEPIMTRNSRQARRESSHEDRFAVNDERRTHNSPAKGWNLWTSLRIARH